MARLKMIDEDQMNPQMAALAEKVRYDPGYHTGLKSLRIARNSSLRYGPRTSSSSMAACSIRDSRN